MFRPSAPGRPDDHNLSISAASLLGVSVTHHTDPLTSLTGSRISHGGPQLAENVVISANAKALAVYLSISRPSVWYWLLPI